MRKIVALLLAGALLVLSACSVTASAATITDPDVKSRGDDEVYADFGECCDDIDAINQKLRGVCIRIAQNFEEDSYIYSPYSLYLALAAVAQGASDEVFDEVYSALAPEGMSPERFKQCIGVALECLTLESGGDTLDIHTLALLNEGYKYDEDFADDLGRYFLGSSGSADLASREAMKLINDWAKEKTNGMIDPFLDKPLDEDTAFALLNSVYFLGRWVTVFDEEDNVEDTFHGASGDSTATFMRLFEAELYYAQSDAYTCVTLPYEGSASMRVYLPAEGMSTDDVLTALAEEDGPNDVTLANVDLKLPKFEAESTLSLTDKLSGTGLEVLCDASASPLTHIAQNSELYIAEIMQKARIKVDEKGTEAAAVTMAAVKECALADTPPRIEFNVDRPFVYTIEKNGTLLFLGVMNDLA